MDPQEYQIWKTARSQGKDDAFIRGVITQYRASKGISLSAQQEEEPNTYGATFRSKPTDTPLQAGLKAAGNLPSSALNLVKGVITAGMNPVQTLAGANKVVAGGVQKLIPGEQKYEQDFNALTGFLKERYGSLENLQKTATEDPVGFGSDILGVITGGAALAGRGAEAANLVSKTAQTVTRPVAATATKVGDITSGSAKFGVSQVTGLNPETITELIKNPQAFKVANQESRLTLATDVGSALDSRLEELSGLGKGYETIRNAPVTVDIPQGTIQKVLDKYGVKLDAGGKIVTSPESRPLSSVDRTALQDFIANYGQETQLSSNAFLNTREALSNLSRFEQGKTSLPQQIARDLRAEYDAIGKSKIPGLKELDAEFAPERQLLGDLKKDIFTSKGELKDNAISKIANLTGKGKEKVLERMKQIVPDIEQRVKVLKAVEDIEKASGLKLGAYVRAGGIVTGALTGNAPVIVASILAQPEIAIPLLKGYGLVGQKAAPVLRALRMAAESVNGFQFPPALLLPVNKIDK